VWLVGDLLCLCVDWVWGELLGFLHCRQGAPDDFIVMIVLEGEVVDEQQTTGCVLI